MAGKRTIYQNWIVEIGREPRVPPIDWADFSGLTDRSNSPAKPDRQLEEEVRAAIELLNAEEREFIIRFHFMGQGYKEISELSGRAIYKLASIHKRAIKKLRLSLAGFVGDRYGLKLRKIANCPICESDKRDRIEQILATKTEESTWRPIIRKLRHEFDIVITTPQQLIGHVKYHRLRSQTKIREVR